MAALPPLPPIDFQPQQLALYNLCRATGPRVPTTIGFGGARGGAKSGGVRRIAIALLWDHPGETVHIIQRTSKSLYDNHLVKLAVEFPQLQKFWSASKNEYKLPGGRRLAFRYGDTPDDIIQLTRGPEPTWSIVDQAEQFMPDDLSAIKVGTRSATGAPGLAKLVLTFNPGGPSTDYLARVFHRKQFKDNENPEDFAFLKAVGWDNYIWFKAENNISPSEFYALTSEERFELFIHKTQYGRDLWALPESKRLGELYGSFDKFKGQYYSDVWEERSCIIPSELAARIIQPWWPRWLATDWGFSHFASTGWYASGLLSPKQIEEYFCQCGAPRDMDRECVQCGNYNAGRKVSTPVKVVIQYRQLTVNDVPEPDLAQAIVARTPVQERPQVKRHYIGPDAYAKRGSANTVVEQMDPWFVKFQMPRLDRADNDRVGGWRLIYNCFAQSRKLRSKTAQPFAMSDQDAPALLISDECPETIQAVPVLICLDKNPQDVRKVEGEMSDDVADQLRYGLKSHIRARDQAPFDVRQVETFRAYQDPTERVRALEILQQQERATSRIRRRFR